MFPLGPISHTGLGSDQLKETHICSSAYTTWNSEDVPAGYPIEACL